jgi:hypothetical protein
MLPAEYQCIKAPVGATHYTDGTDGFGPSWFKFEDGKVYSISMERCRDGNYWSERTNRERAYIPMMLDHTLPWYTPVAA